MRYLDVQVSYMKNEFHDRPQTAIASYKVLFIDLIQRTSSILFQRNVVMGFLLS